MGFPLDQCFYGTTGWGIFSYTYSYGYYCFANNETTGYDVYMLEFNTSDCTGNYSMASDPFITDCGGENSTVTCYCGGLPDDCTTFTVTEYECANGENGDSQSYTYVIDLCLDVGSSSHYYQCASTTSITSKIYTENGCSGDAFECDACTSWDSCTKDLSCDDGDNSHLCGDTYYEIDCQTNDQSDDQSILEIGGLVLGVILLCVLGVIAFCCYVKKKRNIINKDNDQTKLLSSNENNKNVQNEVKI